MKTKFNLTTGPAMLFIAVLLTVLTLQSCTKDATEPGSANRRMKDECLPTNFTLWAGQNTDAGILVVSNDETNLYITYEITNPDPDLAMDELHLWAGTDIADCPQNIPGSPKVGQFPYYASPSSSLPAGSPLLTDPFTYSITIPLSSLSATCGNALYVAAHAKAGTETLWSEGSLFVWNGPWSTYSTYTVCCGAK